MPIPQAKPKAEGRSVRAGGAEESHPAIIFLPISWRPTLYGAMARPTPALPSGNRTYKTGPRKPKTKLEKARAVLKEGQYWTPKSSTRM